MKKIVTICLALAMLLAMTACEYEESGSREDMKATAETTNTLQKNQPTPTDIDYSLERYNLIRRAYWVNGQHEKSASVICPIAKPLGYIALFTENGAAVGRFVVDGKVSSLNSYLTPDSEYYEQVASEGLAISHNEWVADVDGTYGQNDTGIFFFTPDGNYWEWTGDYLYSDVPFEIEDPVINIGE